MKNLEDKDVSPIAKRVYLKKGGYIASAFLLLFSLWVLLFAITFLLSIKPGDTQFDFTHTLINDACITFIISLVLSSVSLIFSLIKVNKNNCAIEYTIAINKRGDSFILYHEDGMTELVPIDDIYNIKEKPYTVFFATSKYSYYAKYNYGTVKFYLKDGNGKKYKMKVNNVLNCSEVVDRLFDIACARDEELDQLEDFC